MQADSQLKLLIRTTKSKLEFKLSKSRALSTHTIQTLVVPELRNLVTLANDSRSFERSLDILKMKLAQLVRNDRSADVWEDLIGELAVLENSVSKLISMIEVQRELANERQIQERRQQRGDRSNGGSGSMSWSFLGFTFGDSSNNNSPRSEQQQSLLKPEENKPIIIKDNDLDGENVQQEGEGEQLEEEKLDRVTKVVRNIIVAQDYLSDDIKELHKLTLALNKCIDKSDVLARSPDTTTKLSKDSPLDLEDRVYIEIVRKLRGDDEDAVVNDYMNELCDIYKIDIYNEGKYKDDEVSDDDVDADSGGGNGNNEEKIVKPQVKKQLDDLDDLKKRFEALKKT